MNTCIFDQLASNQHHHSEMNALFGPTQPCFKCILYLASSLKDPGVSPGSADSVHSWKSVYGSHNCVNTTTACSLKTPRLRSPNPHTYRQDATLQDRLHCEQNQCLNQRSCQVKQCLDARLPLRLMQDSGSVSVALVESSDQVLRCQELRSQMIMAVLPMIQPFCQPCCQLLF